MLVRTCIRVFVPYAIMVDPEGIRASIADDGIGFEVNGRFLRSLGLSGMGERAALVGVRLEIISAPGEGATVTLEVPR